MTGAEYGNNRNFNEDVAYWQTHGGLPLLNIAKPQDSDAAATEYIHSVEAAANKAKLAPTVDDRYKVLQQQQLGQLQKFRSNLPGMADNLMFGERENSRQALAQQMTGIDRNANKRGLLYGGQRLANRSQAATESVKGLQQKRVDINSKLNNVADTMQNQAIETGFGIAGAGQNAMSAQDAAARKDLASQLSERQDYFKGLAGAFGNIGEGIGAAFGSGSKKTVKPVTTGPVSTGYPSVGVNTNLG